MSWLKELFFGKKEYNWDPANGGVERRAVPRYRCRIPIIAIFPKKAVQVMIWDFADAGVRVVGTIKLAPGLDQTFRAHQEVVDKKKKGAKAAALHNLFTDAIRETMNRTGDITPALQKKGAEGVVPIEIQTTVVWCRVHSRSKIKLYELGLLFKPQQSAAMERWKNGILNAARAGDYAYDRDAEGG